MRTICVLARPTPGDDNFYKRWRALGEVKTKFSPDAEILVVDQHTELTQRIVRRYTNLRYVCSATTGHTHLKFDAEKEGLNLITLRGETEFLEGVRSVAEFTLLQMLYLARVISSKPQTLAGKIVGVIGWGRIGSQVADLCEAFGMKVMCFDAENNKYTLPEIFSQADFVTLHLSENTSSKELITEALLTRMKRSAVLINTARPSVMDCRALYNAVVEGRIAGTAVDFASEYQGQPWFHEHPNFLLTPHIAGHTLEDRQRTDDFIVKKLKAALKKEEDDVQ
jgi:D-3-phosphoglycerate dehydrogenase / 2-oxoglutarate reductase